MVTNLVRRADQVAEAIRDDYDQGVIDARIDAMLGAWIAAGLTDDEGFSC